MKSIAITSVALFCLTAASPLHLRQDTINVALQTGDGDSSVGVQVPPNQIVATSKVGGSSGVAASVNTQGVTCQAFKDAAGTQPLDSPFNSTAGVGFNNCAANGLATTCVLSDAVEIGAFCCAADKDFKTNCLANVGGSSNNNGDTVISVQLAGADELAIQIGIPANGSPLAIGGQQLFDSAFIVGLGGARGASCQAFSDAKGTQPVGTPFGTRIAFLEYGREVLVEAVSCNTN